MLAYSDQGQPTNLRLGPFASSSRRRRVARIVLMSILLMLGGIFPAALSRAPIEAGRAEITIIDQAGKPVPCRLHVKDTAGKEQRAGKLPFWRDHFVCPGTV